MRNENLLKEFLIELKRTIASYQRLGKHTERGDGYLEALLDVQSWIASNGNESLDATLVREQDGAR